MEETEIVFIGNLLNLSLFHPDVVSFLAACAGKFLNCPDLSLSLAVFVAVQISIWPEYRPCLKVLSVPNLSRHSDYFFEIQCII